MSRLMIHPTASISPHAYVGLGTKVWHHSQVCDGARIGRDCIVGSNVYIDRDVTVGERVKIQTGVQLYRGVEVEDGVFLGPLACLANDRYPRAITPEGRLKTDADWVQGRVHIGYGASIGAGAVVLPDVTVGKFAMVGAGAVVVEDVPDYGLVLGVPAKLCGYVCACGHRLTGCDASSGEPGWCPLCGVSYRFVPDAPPGLDDSDLHKDGGDSPRPVSAETKKIA